MSRQANKPGGLLDGWEGQIGSTTLSGHNQQLKNCLPVPPIVAAPRILVVSCLPSLLSWSSGHLNGVKPRARATSARRPNLVLYLQVAHNNKPGNPNSTLVYLFLKKSMEDPGAPALRFIDAMEERMVQWMRDRETIKSPLVTYRAQTTALEEMIRNEFARIPPNPSPQDYSAATKNTINFGAQLRDLQLKHDATIDDDKSSYVLALYAHIKAFYTQMFSVMELGALEELFEEYKQNVSKESKPPPKNLPVAGESTEKESTQLQENALPEESVQLDEATGPQEAHQPQETTQRDESTQLAIDHTPTHPDVQVPDTSEQQPDVNMQETDPQELDERATPASPVSSTCPTRPTRNQVFC